MTELAVLYNDQSILENHHVSKAFQMLRKKKLNFLDKMSEKDFKTFRKISIKLVLMTDPSNHLVHL